jgi:hypothetical protein
LRHYGHSALAAILMIALLELSTIGAVAVNLGSTYTFGDVFRRRHSLHWTPSQAPAGHEPPAVRRADRAARLPFCVRSDGESTASRLTSKWHCD